MVRSRRTTTPNRGNLEVEDVGIVYRDHENHEHVDGNDQEVTTPGAGDESFYTTSSEMLPLELDIDKGKTDGLDNEEGTLNCDEDEDGASYSYYPSNNYLLSKIQHRHPAYTPQLFITHPHLGILT